MGASHDLSLEVVTNAEDEAAAAGYHGVRRKRDRTRRHEHSVVVEVGGDLLFARVRVSGDHKNGGPQTDGDGNNVGTCCGFHVHCVLLAYPM